jgi:fibronectin type 3 domain-containing protein
MAVEQYQISKADRKELRRMRDKLDGIAGPNVVNTPTAIYVHGNGPGGVGGPGNAAGAVYEILGAVQDGSNYRWAYTGTRVVWDGDWDWEAVDSDQTVTLKNTYESDNGSSGVVNGDIDLADEDISALLPVPEGMKIVNPLLQTHEGDSVYWFSYHNAPVVECETDGTTDTEAPAAPTGLAATGTGDNTVEVVWDANTETDLSHYNVYRSDTELGTYVRVNTEAITGLSYTDTGLTANTTYWYKGTAVDSSFNESEKSDPDDATTTNNALPAAPTSPSASAASDTQINLTWVASTGPNLDYNKVYRAPTSGGTFALIATNVTGTSYNNTGLDPGTAYYYKLKAVSTFSTESPFTSEFTATTTNVTAPAAPTGLTASGASQTTITLNWNDNSEVDLDGYDVYRSTTSGGVYSKINGSLVTVSNYADTTLSAGVERFYKVKAIDTAANASSFSSIASATTDGSGVAPAPPTNLAVAGLSSGGSPNIQQGFEWDDNAETDLDYYRIYTATVSGGPYSLNANNIVPSFGDATGLSTGTYYFVVTAVNTGGHESDYSNEVTETFF